MLPVHENPPVTGVRSSVWSDFVRLMHLPLPFCVLAFATLGAALSERIYLNRLGLTYLGILLALCLGAYSLDELHGRPYHTKFADRTLWSMAVVGVSGASLVAIYLILTISFLIAIPAALAVFFVFAYNLELFGGRFHNAGWFGVSWGGLTSFGSYFVQATTLSLAPLIVSVMSSLVGMSIVYLTHKFRPEELSKKLEIAPTANLEAYSRYSRKTAWAIAKIECYAMIALIAFMIAERLFEVPCSFRRRQDNNGNFTRSLMPIIIIGTTNGGRHRLNHLVV